MNKLKCYAAGPWFSEEQDRVQTIIENYLTSKETVSTYRPRYDGVKLKSDEFHDPKLREKVFLDNIHNIDDADFVVANLDGREGYLDTGTCYEVGYAMAKGIPVIAYQDDKDGKIFSLIGGVAKGFKAVCTGIEELDSVVNTVKHREAGIVYTRVKGYGDKVLFISPDNTQENIDRSTDLANVLVECYGKNFKWVDKLNNSNIGENTESIFSDINYMVAVIDDRHPVVSWAMGQAFARRIPIISYTNYDFGVNIMLLCSIVTHVKGIDNIKEVIQNIKREGLDSLGKFDSSDIKAY